MNKFLNTLLTYSLVLFALSFALPTYGQPSVRKEAHDGGQGGNNCLENDGTSDIIQYQVTMENLNDISDCDFILEINVGGSISYTPLTDGNFLYYDNYNLYIYNFTVSFTAQQVAAICGDQSFYFTIDLYCEGDEGVSGGDPETNEPGSSSLYPTCCDSELPDDVDPGGYFMSNTKIKDIGLDETLNFGNENTYVITKSIDYYIFDLQGNNVNTLKNISSEIILEQLISNSSLRAGIYIVKYWDGIKMSTQKVFKL